MTRRAFGLALLLGGAWRGLLQPAQAPARVCPPPAVIDGGKP